VMLAFQNSAHVDHADSLMAIIAHTSTALTRRLACVCIISMLIECLLLLAVLKGEI
jgi:hypothetical protein